MIYIYEISIYNKVSLNIGKNFFSESAFFMKTVV